MRIASSTKIETGAAILGATIAAAGAVLVEPILLVIGAVAVTAATVLRVTESQKLQELKGGPYSDVELAPRNSANRLPERRVK